MTEQKQVIPEGYKQTEVGVIPSDWSLQKLEKLTSLIIDGTHHTPTYTANGIPFLRVTDIQGKLDEDNFKYVSEHEHELLTKRCKPAKGDLLLSKNGTIGVPKVINWDWEFSVFVSLALIKLKKRLLNVEYLEQFFKSDFLNLQLAQRAKQGTVTNLHLEEIRELLIPVPPILKEQTAIANALSDVDALIAELEKLIAKKQAIKTATMQQLLTGKTRLPQFALREDGTPKGYKSSELGEIPEDWEVASLKSLSRYINDGTHHTPKYVSIGTPFYSVENVTNNDFFNVKYISTEEHQKLIKRCKPEKGDILLTRIGTLGVTKIIDWDVDASIYVSLALIKLNNSISSGYFYAFSKSSYFKKEIEKRALLNATPQKINMAEIGESIISYPVDFVEQKSIVDFLFSMDDEILVLERQTHKTRQIKQGMMQELLTGKTRLI
nr:restriction endonuclease subunit S [uncultured Tolumonas sp.]